MFVAVTVAVAVTVSSIFVTCSVAVIVAAKQGLAELLEHHLQMPQS